MKSIIVNLSKNTKLFNNILDSVKEIDETLDFETVDIKKEKFSDGELCVSYLESVRGKRVFILSSPTNSDDIMYLNLAIDAAKRSAASEIIPILPFFPYQRSDKKDETRGPIGAKIVAEMIENRGSTGLITFDLHADQIQGFFNIPITHLEGKNVFSNYIKSVFNENTVLCGPDEGSGKRVKRMQTQLLVEHGISINYVMLDKTRTKANVVDGVSLIGDVNGKEVIILDDIIDTASTIGKGVDCLFDSGATKVTAVVSHGVLSGEAVVNIGKSKLNNLIISDSLPIKPSTSTDIVNVIKGGLKISTCSIKNQIAMSIIAICNHSSYELLKTFKY